MPLVSSGVEHGNLRELALARMKDLGTQCRDVRTREVGIQEIHHKVKPYEVSSLGQSKKNSVSGGAAGCLKKGQLGTFFFHFCKKKKNSTKMDNIFYQTNKNGKK